MGFFGDADPIVFHLKHPFFIVATEIDLDLAIVV